MEWRCRNWISTAVKDGKRPRSHSRNRWIDVVEKDLEAWEYGNDELEHYRDRWSDLVIVAKNLEE